MKVIKTINNNVALCLDSKGNEVIIFGKGVGFGKAPYEVELNRIEKSFYGIDERYINIMKQLDENIILISTKIVQYASSKIKSLNSSMLIITLADHISFAIKRYKENISYAMPIIDDIRYLYDVEMDIGKKALSMINLELNQNLPEEEATYIALHIINSERNINNQILSDTDKKIILDITKIIEKNMDIKINMDSFNYSRFVTHMKYLLKRYHDNNLEKDKNIEIYKSLKETLPKTDLCMMKIKEYLEENLKIKMTKEEYIYLVIHISKLCDKEIY